MESDDHRPDAGEPLPIRDRADTGGGWSRAWPLVALALIGLMLLRDCVPSAPSAPSVPPASTAPSSR